MITRKRIMEDIDGKGGFTETLTEEQSSATLKQNSKGEIGFEMKIYADDPEQMKERGKKFLDTISELKAHAIKNGL